jgi:protein tyrosine kinase
MSAYVIFYSICFSASQPCFSGFKWRQMASNSRTAGLAVTAAALALSGVALAAWARWSAAHLIDETHAEATAVAARLGGLVSTTIDKTRLRAQRLAALPAVRGAVVSDVATVRDLLRARGFVLAPAANETIELFQVAPHQRPLSLLRAPETSQSLGIIRANQVRIDEEGGALMVTVAVPAQPLARGWFEGAVAVATRVDLASLGPSSPGAELEGLGEPIALSLQHSPDGARTMAAPVPLGEVAARGTPPLLTVRTSLRPGGGGILWAGRVLLLAAFLAALLTFAANRRVMPPLDEAPTARRHTHKPAQPNAPEEMIEPEPTVRERRSSDGSRLALAWNANQPTPITKLKPQESAPILVDPRGDQLASRYRLLQPLGHGYAADVYLAQSFLAEAPGTVALKILSGPASAERGAFLEAARRQMLVAHDHVARVLDVGAGGAHGEIAYVAMEYVEGCTLEVLLRDLFARDEPLPLPQTLAIMAALCRALDAALPLVHGAVKPSNVLVGRHNVVKLADFGAPPSASDRNAPEQYAGKTPDRRSDVYAVGVVLHELVTGRRMVGAAAGGSGAGGATDAMRWPPLPAPSTLRDDLPRPLDAVVAKATRFGPSGRYPTAGALLTELMRATEGAIARGDAHHAWLGDWVERARRSS